MCVWLGKEECVVEGGELFGGEGCVFYCVVDEPTKLQFYTNIEGMH